MNDTKWTQLASEEQVEKTKRALEANGFNTIVAENGQQAKEQVLSLVPKGANVGVNTSITLDTIGVTDVIDTSSDYDSQRKKWMSLDHKTQARQINMLRSTAEWALGSAHAVTENGQILIASNSGSNLPSYAYTADHVVLVIGTQKLVKTDTDGINRIYEYCLPLETKRARQAYGLPDTWDSFPSKILHFSKEPMQGRTTVILVKEALGY